jgi:hypothetical protein
MKIFIRHFHENGNVEDLPRFAQGQSSGQSLEENVQLGNVMFRKELSRKTYVFCLYLKKKQNKHTLIKMVTYCRVGEWAG